MGQITRTTLFLFVFLPLFFATPRAEEQPDREMLRLMELLEEWEIINNLEPLTPIRKNNRRISGVERLRTPVTGILIVGLQHH